MHINKYWIECLLNEPNSFVIDSDQWNGVSNQIKSFRMSKKHFMNQIETHLTSKLPYF